MDHYRKSEKKKDDEEALELEKLRESRKAAKTKAKASFHRVSFNLCCQESGYDDSEVLPSSSLIL